MGNHDLNLVNPNRQDAITPIVESLGGNNHDSRIFLHKKSGVIPLWGEYGKFLANLYVFSCADQDNFPTFEDISNDDTNIKIGLYHGSLLKAEVDSGWKMSEADTDLRLFEGLDFVLLGDIHKHQFLDEEKRIAYAGSLIQQNFGEDPDKGFLLWDIESRAKRS